MLMRCLLQTRCELGWGDRHDWIKRHGRSDIYANLDCAVCDCDGAGLCGCSARRPKGGPSPFVFTAPEQTALVKGQRARKKVSPPSAKKTIRMHEQNDPTPALCNHYALRCADPTLTRPPHPPRAPRLTRTRGPAAKLRSASPRSIQQDPGHARQIHGERQHQAGAPRGAA